MTYKTIKRVSVPNLKSFGPTKTELWAKDVGEFSIMLYEKMGRGIFKTLNSRNFCVLLVYRPETCRDLPKWGYLHCVKILSKKIVNSNF